MKTAPLIRVSIFADLRPISRTDAAATLRRFRRHGLACHVTRKGRRYFAPVGHGLDMFCIRIENT